MREKTRKVKQREGRKGGEEACKIEKEKERKERGRQKEKGRVKNIMVQRFYKVSDE